MSSLELLFLHNAAMRKEKTKSIWDSRHYVDGYRQNPDYRQEIVFLKQYENQKFLLKKKRLELWNYGKCGRAKKELLSGTLLKYRQWRTLNRPRSGIAQEYTLAIKKKLPENCII